MLIEFDQLRLIEFDQFILIKLDWLKLIEFEQLKLIEFEQSKLIDFFAPACRFGKGHRRSQVRRRAGEGLIDFCRLISTYINLYQLISIYIGFIDS
jgi:hypothetical protein